jgi:PEP-CTERM motif-containing protein
VPEPTTLVSLALGLLVILARQMWCFKEKRIS